jgi:hypothetical protein
LGIIIPTDELIFFRGVETTNQIVYYGAYILEYIHIGCIRIWLLYKYNVGKAMS